MLEKEVNAKTVFGEKSKILSDFLCFRLKIHKNPPKLKLKLYNHFNKRQKINTIFGEIFKTSEL